MTENIILLLSIKLDKKTKPQTIQNNFKWTYSILYTPQLSAFEMLNSGASAEMSYLYTFLIFWEFHIWVHCIYIIGIPHPPFQLLPCSPCFEFMISSSIINCFWIKEPTPSLCLELASWDWITSQGLAPGGNWFSLSQKPLTPCNFSVSSRFGTLWVPSHLNWHVNWCGLMNTLFYWICHLFTFQMLFPFLVSHLEPPIPSHFPCFYEGAPPPTYLIPPQCPGIPLHWGIKPSQHQEPLLPLMPDNVILCYICSWSHGSLYVYSLVGGLVLWGVWWVLNWEVLIIELLCSHPIALLKLSLQWDDIGKYVEEASIGD
jgi:hypothetical protein